MSIETDIPDLLFIHVTAFNSTIQVVLPNIEFTPTQETYLEVQHLPNANLNLYVRDDDPTVYVGLLQITVVAQAGDGEIQPRVLAAQVAEHFSKGTRLQRGSVIVRIYSRPSIATLIKDGDRVRVPVIIQYRSSG
ncbi:DUF4128 domain-containing protein [Bartonella sp. HY329]|uniref:DUF4128 domain-containing protein n=1 Tax=unclassified Bartonella TaxID=2645622 RepID=UPI0021C78034|nr:MULTISPECIES: DUF4128 domain-containing protein [unclassified Bartonella]UXM94647.1 DUF4128 domain-containing protein [Bartonella sp. HY329]UXN08970.1 DUF4128 domain-containing protein [Bartonella sp. HY328]